MKNHIIGTTVITLLGFWPAILQAQSARHEHKSKTERWILSLSLGAGFGGPAKAIEKAMRASGFNSASAGWGPLVGSFVNYYPKSTWFSGGTIGFHYLIKPPFALGLLAGYAQGETKGRHSDGSGSWLPGHDVYLDVKYSVLSFAPLFSVRASWCKLGVGYGLHQIRTYPFDKNDSDWKLGLVLDMGLIVPFKDKPYFGELIFQYQSIERFEIGPYTAASGDFSATFPASQVNYSHLFAGVSVGIRL